MYALTRVSDQIDPTHVTPAQNGHVRVVRYLLLTGIADPTLKGCPEDDIYHDAFTAVDYKSFGGSKVSEANREQCRKLLEAAKPFWEPASYKGPRYSKKRINSKPIPFVNKPTDLTKLREAVQVI